MSIRDYWDRYERWRMERVWGSRVRRHINKASRVVMPYIDIIIPNFVAAHYAYILTWVFLGSVLVYPVRNMDYIDALFLTAGASTQAGLNTIDGNLLTLYQQIIVYIIACLTTPIFIHGSVLFFRLYAFEAHFDNIRESSKLNFKMRRSATLAARTRTNDSTLWANTVNNQGLGLRRPSKTHSKAKEVSISDNGDLEHKLSEYNHDRIPDMDEIMDSSPSTSTSYAQKPQVIDNDGHNYVEHISEPSDDEEDEDVPRRQLDSDSEDADAEEDDEEQEEQNEEKANTHVTNTDGIRFGNLPQPPSKRRQYDVDPSDMYVSISMLREKNKKGKGVKLNETNPLGIKTDNHEDEEEEEEEDDEPVLVIRPPNEIENDSNPIFKAKEKDIKFDKNLPKGKRKKKWSKLKKTFSGTIPGGMSVSESTRPRSQVDTEIENFAEYGDVGDQQNNEELVLQSPIKNHRKSFVRSSTLENVFKGKIGKKRARRDSRGSRDNSFAIVTDDDEGSFDSEGQEEEVDDYEGEEDDDDEDEDRHLGRHRSDNMDNQLGKVMSGNYLSWVPTIGRNSNFTHLSKEQKEELGGVEYRSVKLLIKILLFYYIGFHFVALFFFLGYIRQEPQYQEVIREQGVLPTWWAFFTSSSSFNDLGLTLTNNSMVPFSRSTYILIVASFFIIIGNTGFPIFLRFIIWILFKCSKPLLLFKESLGFLLDHPRRCFTLLFPSIPTWWLFFILVLLNGIDLVLFIILDLNNEYLLDIPVGYRILDGLFQAFSTRTAGFSVVDLSQLHPAVQVSYMLMMYISVLPLAISIRRTNVYEEQSLGVYLKGNYPEEEHLTEGQAEREAPKPNDEDMNPDSTPKSFIGAHLRNQLSFDLWFVFLGFFIICIAEGGNLTKDPLNFSIFKVLFEIISAYGTVGLSLGFVGINASFSAEFSVISKLVIIAMMIRGRHRGLPYKLDRAVMLPDSKMEKIDDLQEEQTIRRNRTNDTANQGSNHHNHHHHHKISPFDELPLKRVFTRRGSNYGFDRLKRTVTNVATTYNNQHQHQHQHNNNNNNNSNNNNTNHNNQNNSHNAGTEGHELRDISFQIPNQLHNEV